MTDTTGLALLRQPFPPNHISKLPKPTKAQTDAVKADFKKGVRCQVCGAWHHPDVIHLDYVGHAALTDRLLDADIGWTWEPLTMTPGGVPTLDPNGGMWIKLTVAGVTRLGYGHAGDKSGGDAIKEIIGDALRNAAMRFGAALDLWHKGDLHADDTDDNARKHTPDSKVLNGAVATPSGLSQERMAELDDLAAYIIERHEAGEDLPAIKAARELKDNDEKLHLWAALKPYSKLRAAIKANP